MKAFWKSKTVWGVLLAAIPGVGVPLSAAVLSIPQAEEVPAELQAIVAGIGAILAIYGRYKADGQLSIK
jgi:hypothetical protein